VLYGPHDLRVLDDVPVPVPGPGELLIRTMAAAICNATDVHIWSGEIGEEVRPPFPHVLGHERAGVVEAVGEGVEGFGVGDRVACWSKMDGAFGEYDLLRPAEFPTVRLRDDVSDDAGAMLEFVGATLRGLEAARLEPGERVLVLGQGVQGLTLAQEAKLRGARQVVGVDRIAARLERAASLGVDATYDLTGRSWDRALEELRSVLAGGEADVVIDAAGAGGWPGGNSVNLALELVRWSGRYVVYALPTRDLTVNARLIALKGIRVQGIDTPPHEVGRLLEEGQRWVAEGRLELEGLITHRVPLEGIEDGLARCRDRPDETLKVMVDVGNGSARRC
ncbi:MAG: zinc-dependent alcohol dehydrogenase, partial [Gemmatimonadota bacterium]